MNVDVAATVKLPDTCSLHSGDLVHTGRRRSTWLSAESYGVFKVLRLFWSQGSVVDVAIRLRAEWSEVRILLRTIYIYLLPNAQISFKYHLAPVQWMPGSFPGSKAAGA
jgi:hypothetical protein